MRVCVLLGLLMVMVKLEWMLCTTVLCLVLVSAGSHRNDRMRR